MSSVVEDRISPGDMSDRQGKCFALGMRPTRWQLVNCCVTGLAWIVLWLSLVRVPARSAGPDLDPSWMESYAYFWKQQLQAGHDYVFTYGPLGYFSTTVFDPELFWSRYAVELVAKAVLALIIYRFSCSVPGLTSKMLFGGAIVVCCLRLVLFDSLYLLCIVFAFLLVTRKRELSLLRDLAPFTAMLAVLALVKFTLLVVAVFVAAVLSCYLLATGRRLYAALPLLCFTVWFCLFWTLLGQPLAGLFDYLSNSLEVASGYVQGMARHTGLPGGVTLHVALGGCTLLLMAAAVIPLYGHEIHGARGLLNARVLSAAAVVGCALFLSWKQGFVRADSAHVINFFAVMLPVSLLPPVVLTQYNWQSPRRRALITVCFFTAVVGFSLNATNLHSSELVAASQTGMLDRVRYVVRPALCKLELTSERNRLADEWNLPRVKQRVGAESVDIISFEQGVLLLNDLHWKPRPVFQSYCAYTPRLLAANARFFRSDDAPKFVLLKIQPIDERLPPTEDSLALLEVLQRYRPVLSEKSYLLLEQRADEDVAHLTLRLSPQKVIRFGQTVLLDAPNDPCQIIALDVRLSWIGRLMKLFYRVPDVGIQLITDTGETLSYRLVPPMVRDGFLLNPLLLKVDDLPDFFAGLPGRRVTALRLTCSHPSSYHADVRMTTQNGRFADIAGQHATD